MHGAFAKLRVIGIDGQVLTGTVPKIFVGIKIYGGKPHKSEVEGSVPNPSYVNNKRPAEDSMLSLMSRSECS